MREVTIYTEKDEFYPGDEVSGHAVVKADESFTCNRIILKLRGREYTHYQSGKVHVSDTHDILKEDITILEDGEVHSGETRFEFSFILPEEIPPVYEGYYGTIDYSIEAVVEVDKAMDPKSKIQFDVYSKPPSYIPEPLDRLPTREEREHLYVELLSDILRPNKGLVVRFLAKERSRIKGVRIDIVKRDYITCRGTNLNSSSAVSETRIPISFNEFDRWIEETIHEDWNSAVPFEGNLIRSTLELKVVLEVGLSMDPYIEFPLQLSGEGEKEDDLFDSIEMDFGW